MKESHDYVHPKKILRTINRNMPEFSSRLSIPLRAVITALYTYSNGWHEAEDLAAGHIKIGGTISYGQLADALPCAYITAKRHCARLRKMGLMTWVKHTQYIEFTLLLAAAASEMPALDAGNKFRTSRLLTAWRWDESERDMVGGYNMRYRDGRCPDCKWERRGRGHAYWLTHWCLDCYEEVRGEGETDLGVLLWESHFCPTCGDSGCDCKSTDICKRKTEVIAQLGQGDGSVGTEVMDQLVRSVGSPE